MKKIIRISHKDLNEYIRNFSEKVNQAPEETVTEPTPDMKSPNNLGLTEEQVNFLVELMGSVIPDDEKEEEMITSIKDTLNATLATQQNEKR